MGSLVRRTHYAETSRHAVLLDSCGNMQVYSDRIKQHVSTRIKIKSKTAREHFVCGKAILPKLIVSRPFHTLTSVGRNSLTV